MSLPADIRVQKTMRSASTVFAYMVLTIAILVLSGWALNIPVLRRIGPSLVSMNPTTAAGFLVVVLSFFILSLQNPDRRLRILAYVMAGLLIAVGITRLLEIAFDTGTNIDTYLFGKQLAREAYISRISRISPNTAIGFVLCGFTLLSFHYRTKKGYRPFQIIALLVFLLSLLTLLSYLYQASTFFGLLPYVPMSLNTAICFLLLSMAFLFAQPGVGLMSQISSSFSGSLIGRILIPASILIPSILGLLRLWGYWEGMYENEFGVTLSASITILFFTAVVFFLVYSLNKRDLQKKQTETALHQSEEQLRVMFDQAPDAVIVIDSAGKVLQWNKEAERIFGWKVEEVTGKLLSDIIIPEAFREAHIRGLSRYLESGKSNLLNKTIDLWGLVKDGSSIDISLRISPLHLHDRPFFVGFVRDITDKKKIENRLKSFNEELYQQVENKTREYKEIVERITDGFIALDKDLHYIYVNKKAGELTHRDPASLIGKYIWDEFPPAVGTETYQAINHAMQSQEYIRCTDYFEPLKLWQENDIYPSPNGLSIFIRDVTARRNAEQEITRARDLADKLINSLPGVFYFYNAEGKFIRWNKQFETVTGYSAEQIAMMHPTQFFPEDEQDYISGRISDVFLNGENDAEASFLTPDGRRIPHYFKAVLLNYDGGPCLLGTGIDITERRKSEEQLKASEQKYKLLFESNPLPMWMLSLPDYRIVEVNDATLLQYGYRRDEFLALDIFSIRPQEDIEILKEITEPEFRGIHHSGVWRHLKKDGTLLFVNIVTHDIIYEGRPTRLVLAHNVTEQHLAEEKLKESYESIRDLTGHLQNIREEERLHIAREIHDELGQLLTVLKMDVSWLNKKLEKPSEPIKDKLSEVLTLIDTTVKTVRRIASELRPSLLDDLGLHAAMEWHLEEFERRSGITQEIHVVDGFDKRLPDEYKIGLFRIFQESLTNVARHSGGDNVKVTLLQKENALILTISDNGKGFDPEKANQKTLGLLGMKERTQAMGGEYKIEGISGIGTTVTVKVPIPEKEPENQPHA